MTRSVVAILAAVTAVSVCLSATQGSARNAQATKKMSATGIVTSVSSASLVIEGKEKQSITFAVDWTTRIFGRGAITKLLQPAIGRRLKITDLVHRGDLVTVRYYVTGTTMRASDVLLVREFWR